ncbi:MAG: zf-HC2 domain-containing protein [Gemmatimonadales bacterium]|jgi:hypothetical protein
MVADCPGDYEKILWLFDDLPGNDRARVADHIASCQRCAEDLVSLRRAVTLLEAHEGAGTPKDDNECLDEADLAGWVDGSLDSESRASVLSHVSNCPRCRHAAASLVGALRSDPVAPAIRELERSDVPAHALGRRRRYRLGAVAAAIAAVLAGIVFLRPTDLEIEEAAHRDVSPGAISLPQPIAPLGELAAVEAFTWSAVSGADRYRLTVFDEEGTVVWEAETEETRLAVPTTVRFERGVQFFWKVHARVGFDRWLDSELVTFTIS